MRSLRLRAIVLSGSVLLSTLLPALPAHADSAPTLASRMAAVQAANTINYYPSNAGWTYMWTNFDLVRIHADLNKAAALGADTVRAIVFPQTFGYPVPSATYTNELSTFVDLAEANGLDVKLTLFDWWSGYSDVAGSITWAQALLAPYANDPRVIAVELKNEIPPNDATAINWARQLIPAIRATAPAMPITLTVDGTSGATGMATLKTQLATTPLDFYDFHFYGASERALAEIRRAQTAVAPDPVVIGETGLSTLSASEGEQGAYLARVFRAAGEAGIGSVAPWTLNDFAQGAIPANSSVSTQPAQYKFGLHRTDGTSKFSAPVVDAAWTSGSTPNSILNLGFEAAAVDSPWRQYLPQAGAAVMTTESARTGTKSAKFSGTTRSGSNLPSLLTSPITPVQAGQAWHAEAYARGVSAAGITEIALSWFDINGTWISQNTSNRLPTGTTSWTKLSVDTVAPAGAASVQLHLKSGDNTGTVYYDDVTIS
ncbi:cellulase family glycosylhydrolase [Paractinoplanes atraurantiacus]|uniref:Cellulase (Glycosyl hydrolase family 5) n=1 Tax=Paractinoplanes atraurantiacus TaxID=1036182 RepID=A0A285JUR7_9ACTN|nr:cellulase family glycosylhydrolase [Actinoplanes atraurantiacus]SNY64074.1 Cellulase (glycosyl hydrolase family 5) [Actinoplanes atraurantiacus]